jgi:hypothetical protein
MQRVGCDRIHELETLHEVPLGWDHHPKGADAQTALDYGPRINNGGYSTATSRNRRGGPTGSAFD